MKKFFAFVLVCCLVFSSSSIVFATATQWDTSDQTNLSNIAKALTTTSTGTLLRSVNSILTALTSTTQQGSLYNGVAYLYDIRQYASQIASGLNGTNGSFLEKIYNALIHTDAAGIVYSYVTDIYQKVTEIDNTVLSMGTNISDIKTNTGLTKDRLFYNQKTAAEWLKSIDDRFGLTSYPFYYQNNPGSSFGYQYYRYGALQSDSYTPANQPILGGFLWLFQGMNYSLANGFADLLVGAKTSQTITSWLDLSSSNFTPTSATNGIYTYLANIQNPLARLSYVHASDEEIAARQKAEENQTAVVDNFIDSSGSGSAAPSDFSNVSNLSSGFKDNIATDASVSGIWNIFNSDNFGWFSQETADQLDTTGSSSRMLKSSGSYPTPLLDQQTEDILNYLGGNNND